MAINQTFVDFVTPIPADWLNNINALVSNSDIIIAQNSSAQSIPTGAQTTVTNWTLVSDKQSRGHFNLSTGVFTAAQSGYYRITGMIVFNGAMAALSAYGLFLVGPGGVNAQTGTQQVDNGTPTSHVARCEGIVFMNVGQTATLAAYQTTGGFIPLSSNNQANTVTIQQVG